MNKTKYNILLPMVQKFFTVNDDLRNDLNRIALEEHKITLDNLIIKWCKKSSNLEDDTFNELIEYLNVLNSEPHCISEMDEMYDFVYDFEP